MLETVYEIDFAVLGFIRENLRCGFMDVIMKLFTYAGNYGFIWIAMTIAMLISKKHRRLGVIMAIGLALCLVTGNLILKPLVSRDRPFVIDPRIFTIIPPPPDYSFPSGHTFSSFTSASIIAMHSKRAGAAALSAAALIGFSRLYFCVHFPSDVLCGAAFGIVIGVTVCLIMNRRKKENDTNGSSPASFR